GATRGTAGSSAVGGGRRAARAPALRGRSSLRGRSPPPRDRGGDRLLGGGGTPLFARGTVQVEKGGGGMTSGKQAKTSKVEQMLRQGAEREQHGGAKAGGRDAAAAARRLSARVAEEGLADVSYAPADSPFGALLLAATKRGLVRVAFPEEDVDSVLERLALKVSPRIVEAPATLD